MPRYLVSNIYPKHNSLCEYKQVYSFQKIIIITGLFPKRENSLSGAQEMVMDGHVI